MSNEYNDQACAELAAQVAQLSKRVDELQAQITNLTQTRPVPEEDLLVIAAAAAAYMGFKGTVKAVSYANKGGWRSAGRRALTTNVNRGTMPASAM